MSEIKFGTDGWRAVIAEDFTFANVRCVCQAVANHLEARGLQGKGVVIGYDTRFLAEKFALTAAEVLAGNGIRVFLCKKHVPTPVVAHAVAARRAGGALMLTASHNPAEYLGIKFIPDYAGPALPDDIAPIVSCLDEVFASGKVNRKLLALAFERGQVEIIEPKEDYFRHLESLLDFTVISRSGLSVVVDPMHGAGLGYLEEILARHGCRVTAIRNWRDPMFGGSLPEPTSLHLRALAAKVRETGADIGLALDGDADRLGVVDADGRFYSPNEILILFMEYLISKRGWQGVVARTVATTHMLDRIAARYGFQVVETPVGFKYIGQVMREQDAFLGGEESGGVSIRGHVPEKDGILASLLFVEMLAGTGKKPFDLLNDIYSRFGPLYSERLDLRVSEAVKGQMLENLSNWAPQELCGVPVVSISRVDGHKLILADGGWCLVRASGTEPVFRIYVEADSVQGKQALQEEVKKVLCANVKEEVACII
jgi:alpha-D-glucose phosphate-specific phosphoglucomutase